MSGMETLDWEPGELMERTPGVPEETEQEQGLALGVILQAFSDIHAYIVQVKKGNKVKRPQYSLAHFHAEAVDAYLFLIGQQGPHEPQWIRAYCRIADVDWQTVLDAVTGVTEGGLLLSDPTVALRINLPCQGRIRPQNKPNHRHFEAYTDHDDAYGRKAPV